METHSPKPCRVIVQPRDRSLFEALGTLRFVDIDQARRVAGFTSSSRCKSRLLALHRAGLLGRFFVGTIPGGRKVIYSLPEMRRRRERRPIISVQTELFVDHQLALNEIYLALGTDSSNGPMQWERCTAAVPDGRGVIPDARIELEINATKEVLFIEVDLGSESSTVWQRKVEGYLLLARSGYCTRSYGVPAFRVLVVARGEDRIQAIRRVIARSTDRIFWLASIESIKRDGFWSPIWLRPTADQQCRL